MRTKGLPALPMRLNTYERVKKDIELQRITSGKYQKIYKFNPSAKKTRDMGTALGTIYKKDHTNPKGATYAPKKKWLGKAGDAFYGLYAKSGSLSHKAKTELDMNGGVLLEYLANNMYRLLSDGSFETTKMRLAYLPIMDEFLKNHFLAQIYVNEDHITNSLRVMSKWVDGYRDLGELKVKDKKKVISFMKYIEEYKRPPLFVIEPKSKKEIELKGTMGVLAAATSLADIDVLGGSGKNTGFIIERDKHGEMIRARVIKIDPGYALSTS